MRVIRPNSGAAVFGWVTQYEVDYRALPAQDFKAGGDGTYTIDGIDYAVSNTATASVFRLSALGIEMTVNSTLRVSVEDLIGEAYDPTARWRVVAGYAAAPTVASRMYLYLADSDSNPRIVSAMKPGNVCELFVQAASGVLGPMNVAGGIFDTHELELRGPVASLRASNRADWPPEGETITYRGHVSVWTGGATDPTDPATVWSTQGFPDLVIAAESATATLQRLLIQRYELIP